MIEVLFAESCIRKLRRELRRAGSKEIGGVLAGENLGGGRFRVVDLSVQRAGGSFASFVRDPTVHRRFMRRFAARTGYQHERFNYFGEWHSHPSFLPIPSTTDMRQMQMLIEEKDQSAMFLVLVVVKLDRSGCIEASAHAFRRGISPIEVEIASGFSTGIKASLAGRRITPMARLALRLE